MVSYMIHFCYMINRISHSIWHMLSLIYHQDILSPCKIIQTICGTILIHMQSSWGKKDPFVDIVCMYSDVTELVGTSRRGTPQRTIMWHHRADWDFMKGHTTKHNNVTSQSWLGLHKGGTPQSTIIWCHRAGWNFMKGHTTKHNNVTSQSCLGLHEGAHHIAQYCEQNTPYLS